MRSSIARNPRSNLRAAPEHFGPPCLAAECIRATPSNFAPEFPTNLKMHPRIQTFMRSRKNKSVFLPLMMADLTLASWETITHRMLLISQNKCSQSEYKRMVSEKAQAAMASGRKLISSHGQASIASLMAPWLSRATANAKRLRKKK
jgi:hypothetical protein